MPWWLWILIGFLLFAAEAMTPSLHIAFFGFGALVTGLVVAFGAGGPLWAQLLIFSAVSVVSLLVVRPILIKRFKLQNPLSDKVDTLLGQTAIATEEIEAGGMGKAELRGSTWNASNIGGRPLQRGERCVVDHIEGLTLYIRPQQS